MDLIRKRFAATGEAAAAGLGASHFSFNSKEGRCSTCEGLGVQRVGLHLLEDLELECDACAGGSFASVAGACARRHLQGPRRDRAE